MSDVVHPFVKGGAQKRIHEIGVRLVDRGHDVTIYGRHWWDGPTTMEYEGITLKAIGEPRDLYVDERRSITEAVEFGKDTFFGARRHASDHDIVDVSMFPYFPLFGAALGMRGTDTALATTWLEVWGEYWNDYLGIGAPVGKSVERLATKVPQHPIAISETTADRLADLGIDRDQIHVVRAGVDTEMIESLSPANEGFDVLFAGRLIEDKNVDMLIDAFKNVADGRDATLGIIGDGPQFNNLKEQAARSSVSDQISFLGFLEEYEDVLRHMRAADIFVSPSTREGFGITLAEAMAAECVVITVSHPDSAATEVVNGGGFATGPSVDELSETIGRALNGDTPPKNPLDVAKRFDWDRIADQAESAYNAIYDRFRS